MDLQFDLAQRALSFDQQAYGLLRLVGYRSSPRRQPKLRGLLLPAGG